MDRPPRSKGNNVLWYLQKAATFTISNKPHSPRGGADRRSTKGFSGPIRPLILTRGGTNQRKSDEIEEEPTSPKVTCIGQIKQAKKTKKKATEREPRKKKSTAAEEKENRRRVAAEAQAEPEAAIGPDLVPGLGKMRRFASGRETLAGFDWEMAVESFGEEREDGESIYHSGPILLGGGKAAAEKKNVGLWRRRALPEPLHLRLKQ